MPLIGHALAEAKRGGFDAAVVVISPAKDSLGRYLTDNRHPLPVEVVVQPEPMGIGDAVLRCWQGEPAAVLLPDDVVLESHQWTQLIQLARQSGAATLCIRPVPMEAVGRFGIVERAGDRVVRLVEKPPRGTTTSNLAIFGRYVVTESVISGLRSSSLVGELELTYGFAAALKTAAGVRAVEFQGEIFDCGTPAEYEASKTRFPGTASSGASTES